MAVTTYIKTSNACFLIVPPREFLSHSWIFTYLIGVISAWGEVLISVFLTMSEVLHLRVEALVFTFLWNAIHILCPSFFRWFFTCQFLGALYPIGSLPFVIWVAVVFFVCCFFFILFFAMKNLFFILLDISVFPLWPLHYPGPLLMAQNHSFLFPHCLLTLSFVSLL